MKKMDKKYSQYLYPTKLAQIPQLLLENICPCENKRKFTSTKTQLNFYFVGLTHFNVGYTHLILIEEIKKENIQIDIYFAVQIFLEHLWPKKRVSIMYFITAIFLITAGNLISFCKKYFICNHCMNNQNLINSSVGVCSNILRKFDLCIVYGKE